MLALVKKKMTGMEDHQYDSIALEQYLCCLDALRKMSEANNTEV